jgi:hypothetical protein
MYQDRMNVTSLSSGGKTISSRKPTESNRQKSESSSRSESSTARPSAVKGEDGQKPEVELKVWKDRLATLERKYKELEQRGNNPNWEELKNLLEELKLIMEADALEEVVELQNGIARIRSKVLRIQRKRQEERSSVSGTRL